MLPVHHICMNPYTKGQQTVPQTSQINHIGTDTETLSQQPLMGAIKELPNLNGKVTQISARIKKFKIKPEGPVCWLIMGMFQCLSTFSGHYQQRQKEVKDPICSEQILVM